MREYQCVPFRVVAGRGAASGVREYGALGGSIRAQKPHFLASGLDLSAFHDGTINADIAPWHFEIVRPLRTMSNVKWHPAMPAENFSFAEALIRFAGEPVAALVYYPRPETKAAYADMPPDTLIELLAPPIEGLTYGRQGLLYLDPRQVVLHRSPPDHM